MIESQHIPLPLVHEHWGEGMYLLRKELVKQHPYEWYQKWHAEMYKEGTIREDHEKGAHDHFHILAFSLLFLEDGLKRYPAFYVSPSVDATEKYYWPQGYPGPPLKGNDSADSARLRYEGDR